MQDYASRSAELIDQIDAGELDATDVDVREFVEDETKVLTPQLAQLLPDEKLEEYNQLKQERDFEDLQSQKLEQAKERSEALEKLRDPQDGDTAMVESGQVELRVKTHLNEEIERKIDVLGSRGDQETQRRLLPEVLAWLVVEPEEYTDADIWRAYASEYGLNELGLVMLQVLEPALDRAEDHEVVKKFRAFEDRDALS